MIEGENMKKIIAFICSFLITNTICTYTVSNAEDDTALYELASSLGADTDYLNIPNFKHHVQERAFSHEVYLRFLENCTNYEASNNPEGELFMGLSGGLCYGISAVQMLSHNGVISPSDIVNGAETLCEISYSPETDVILSGYHTSQVYYDNNYLINYRPIEINSRTQCDELIKTAERNMAENRYFVILYAGDNAHAVTGIGIADGSWKYGGVEFDKCILTLDSNSYIDENTADPFRKESCIFINSKTKEYYVPKYKFGTISGSVQKQIITIDDDEIVNYHGVIAPTVSIERDLPETASMILEKSDLKRYDVTVKDKEGNEHSLSELGNKIGFIGNAMYYIQGRDFHIDVSDRTQFGKNYNDKFSISTQGWYFEGETVNGHGIFDVNGQNQSVSAKGGEKTDYIMTVKYNEGNYPCTPHFNWSFSGETASNLKTEITEKGMILHSDGSIETKISTADVTFNEKGGISDAAAFPCEETITAVNDVLVTFDDNNKLCFYIDPDGDGVFGKAVEKGDVNSDGIIDGRDASAVLAAYAKCSADKKYTSYLNSSLSDYNNDNIIDGRDASDILTYYAQKSVNF